MKKIFLSVLVIGLLQTTAYATPTLNTAKIEYITGIQGVFNKKNNSLKLSLPRADLNVAVTNVKLLPQMGLLSWIIFKKNDEQVTVTGELALAEEQVNDVLTTAVNNNLNITALGNHYLWEASRAMYLRFEGNGDETKLALAVKKVLATVKQTSDGKGEFPYSNIDITKSNINAPRMDALLGLRGTNDGGIYKVVLSSQLNFGGYALGDTIGTNSWAAFGGTDDEAVVHGQLALLGNELSKIISPLRQAGIYVVGINQHLTERSKPYVLLQFWGIGKTAALARGLRIAIEAKKSFENKVVTDNSGKLLYSTVEKSLKPLIRFTGNEKTDDIMQHALHDR